MPEKYSSQTLRLFIAIAVPPVVRKEIARVQSQLRRHTPAGAIRWSRPEQFHTTLKFLGEVPLDRIKMLENTVSDICAAYPALQLAAHGIGFFPSVRKPSVIWVGTDDGCEQLARLHQLLEEALRPFEPAGKVEQFTGHITLGHFVQGHRSAIKDLLQYATVLRQQHFGHWLASEVKIVHSELTAAGVKYRPVMSCPLAG